MKERAAAAVLTDDTYLISFSEQRRIGQRFGEAPIERLLPRGHSFATLNDVGYLAMQPEVRRKGGQLDRKLPQLLDSHAGDNRFLTLAALLILAPVNGVLVPDHAERMSIRGAALVEDTTILLDHFVRFIRGDDFC